MGTLYARVGGSWVPVSGGGISQADADLRYVNIDGDTMTGTLNIGTPSILTFNPAGLRQTINLWGTTYGIGVQSNHLYMRSPSSFNWFVGGTHSNTAQDPGAGGTQVLRIDNTGAVFVPGWMLFSKPGGANIGTVGVEVQSALGIVSTTTGTAGDFNYYANKISGSNAAGQSYMTFRVGSAGTSVAGNINLAAGPGVTYGTTSDRRLKRLIAPVEGATERVRRLKVWHFAWKVDDRQQDGFVADEVQQVVPDAVNGEPDAVDDTGQIIPQQLDQARLVPLLTAALQEALDRIEILEQRVAQLEAA